MDEIKWTVGKSGDHPSDKIPYIAQARSSADMTDGQKQFISNYNLMRNALINNGLMEKKD